MAAGKQGHQGGDRAMGMALVPGGNSSTFPFSNRSIYLPFHHPSHQSSVILSDGENIAFFKKMRFFHPLSLTKHDFPMICRAVQTARWTML